MPGGARRERSAELLAARRPVGTIAPVSVDDDLLRRTWRLIDGGRHGTHTVLSSDPDGASRVIAFSGGLVAADALVDSAAGPAVPPASADDGHRLCADADLAGVHRALAELSPDARPATITTTVEASRVGSVASLLTRSTDRWAADVGAGIDVECARCHGSGAAASAICGWCADSDSTDPCQRCGGSGRQVSGCWWCAATGRQRTSGMFIIEGAEQPAVWLDVDASAVDVVNARVERRSPGGSTVGWNEWRLDFRRAARHSGVQLPGLIGLGDRMVSVAEQHPIARFQPLPRLTWGRQRRKADLFDHMCRRTAAAFLRCVPAGAHPSVTSAWWLTPSRTHLVLDGCEFDRLGRVVTAPMTVWPARSASGIWSELCRFAGAVAVEIGSGWTTQVWLGSHASSGPRTGPRATIVARPPGHGGSASTILSASATDVDAAVATLLWRARRIGVDALAARIAAP